MDFDVIITSLRKSILVFIDNIVAYIVSFLICAIGSCFIIPAAPLMYGLFYMVLKGARDEKPEIKDVFYGLSSGRMFFRSWVGFIVAALPVIVVGAVFSIIISVAALKFSAWTFLLFPLMMIIIFILVFFLYFALYIYVMTPAKNIIYAMKKSFRISKTNIIMTLLTIIIAYLCSAFVITMPLGSIFAAKMLKELDPSIKDQSINKK